MFGERDVLVKREQYRDLVREAERKRFVRQARTENAQPSRVRFLKSLMRSVRQRAVGAERGFTAITRR